MRRADRLLQIVQILRRERKPVSAQRIAKELEVTVRTVYRDMVAMESINVPVRGEAGIGYVLEEGYDLPPLMFDSEELEALVLGIRFVQFHGDPDQALSAQNIVAKIGAVLPDKLREELFGISLFVPPRSNSISSKPVVDSKEMRLALRKSKIVDIAYGDEAGQQTQRRIWPFSMGYFETTRIVLAWCEMRQDFRSFRIDRIIKMEVTEFPIPRSQAVLLKAWLEREERNKRVY